ncbi:MAG: tetratricopeptide repeat protein [Pseudomonadota bacterium]
MITRIGLPKTILVCAVCIFAGNIFSIPSFAQEGSTGFSDKAAAVYEAGIAALKERDFKRADALFDEALDEQSDHPEANYFRGLANAYLDKDRQAEKYLKRAIKARSSFVEAREWLATIHVRRGDMGDANDQLTEIESLLEKCTDTLCDDAYVERAERAIAKVKAQLEKAG